MENAAFYVFGLTLSIREDILEELRRMFCHKRSSLIEIGYISAIKGRSQRAFIEPLLPRQVLNSKTSKKGLTTFMVGDNPDAPCTGSTLPKNHGPESPLFKKQSPESQLLSLNTVELVRKLEQEMLLESVPTADDLHYSLQQQDLSGGPLLQE